MQQTVENSYGAQGYVKKKMMEHRVTDHNDRVFYHNRVLYHKKHHKTIRRRIFFFFGAILVVLFFLYKKEVFNHFGNTGYADSFFEMLPEYSGQDCIVLNGGRPDFGREDPGREDLDRESLLQTFFPQEEGAAAGECYSDLDALGRCGTAVALLDKSMMPTGERGEIGSIRPSGWVQAKYPGIIDSRPPYLYNRCHLIGYLLTGQNANERNLITGTRYLNVELMLPYEIRVARYLDHSDNHVLYRVTPHFKDDELVARGVEMEAYSLEDDGAGVCYHVFLYNIQPGIEIDYRTGESRLLTSVRHRAIMAQN